MALDLASTLFLQQMQDSGRQPMQSGTPDEARAASAAMVELLGPAPPMARVSDHQVTSPDGASFALRVLVPIESPRGVIIYYHGGGWVIGSMEQSDTVARKLAERTSCAVVVPDYRLAPEHRYPAAVEDAYATLEWTASRLDEFGGPQGKPLPLIVSGDSAGGNLAAVVARRARDAQGPDIALQVLIYPVTDANFDQPSYLAPENQTFLERETMVWFWDHYLPEVERRAEPDASPLQAEDLSKLPPAVVLTAEHDVLRDEGEAYARALEQAGVPVDFRRHPGQIHGFFTLLMLPGSEAGFQQVVKAVKACLYQAHAADQ
ncbi:MAG: alpha/beta hydrolase [Pseudomonadota bacterium]|nr:alpha/beta hydrolase [Pseudomonadota bacterium]